MDQEEKILAIALLLEEEINDDMFFYTYLGLLNAELRKKRKQEFKKYRQKEYSGRLLIRCLLDDDTKFREYFSVSKGLFYSILSSVKDIIDAKKDHLPLTNQALPVRNLLLTLRYIASGEDYETLANNFKLLASDVNPIIKDTLKAICIKMKCLALPVPNRKAFENVADGFYKKWNFPNCSGTLDGRYIMFQHSKKENDVMSSVLLFAIIDDNFKFLDVDVILDDKEDIAETFSNSFLINNLEFPEPSTLPGTDKVVPHILLGNSGFQLTPMVMTPYSNESSKLDTPKKVFNEHLQKARKTCENAFGILCQNFRIFFTLFSGGPRTVEDLIVATCIIHNLSLCESLPDLCFENLLLPRDNLVPLPDIRFSATFDAYRVRDSFKDYFCSRKRILSCS